MDPSPLLAGPDAPSAPPFELVALVRKLERLEAGDHARSPATAALRYALYVCGLVVDPALPDDEAAAHS